MGKTLFGFLNVSWKFKTAVQVENQVEEKDLVNIETFPATPGPVNGMLPW